METSTKIGIAVVVVLAIFTMGALYRGRGGGGGMHITPEMIAAELAAGQIFPASQSLALPIQPKYKNNLPPVAGGYVTRAQLSTVLVLNGRAALTPLAPTANAAAIASAS